MGFIMAKKETLEEYSQMDPSQPCDALTFADFKKSLGDSSNKYSDDEIEVLRITLDKIADHFFSNWLNKKNEPYL